jgi:hypothetical protein
MEKSTVLFFLSSISIRASARLCILPLIPKEKELSSEVKGHPDNRLPDYTGQKHLK